VRKSINAITALLEPEQQSLAAKNLERATISRQLEEGNLSATDRVALLSRAALLDDRLRIARDRVTEHQNKLEFLQNEQRSIDQELEAAKQEKKLREQETLNAEENLKEIANPLSPRNIVRWFVNHGPNLIVIAVVTVGLYLFMRTFTQQIVGLLIRAGSTVRPDERENRASTLTGVFRYIVGVFILGGGLVMLLDEAGVPIVPFMGGAAVFGLAVAFGAQNLIKDYFSGFMMLMEDQYGVNDVVRINQTAGQVEEITLRITVLRDLEGIRHFIPHGTITQVSNLTHTWSRAMFDIPVAYSTNVDQAIATLMQLANDLRKDPIHGPTIIEEPEMLGVDQFTASAVVIKFVLKTKPLKQWPVKRELLRRIKNRFDELGIKIPVNAHTIEVKGGLGWPGGDGAGLAGRAENGTLHSTEPARSPYGY
jgi:small conductance mechanosensitive channel